MLADQKVEPRIFGTKDSRQKLPNFPPKTLKPCMLWLVSHSLNQITGKSFEPAVLITWVSLKRGRRWEKNNHGLFGFVIL